MQNGLRSALVFSAVVSLAACGGGGDGHSGTSTTATHSNIYYTSFEGACADWTLNGDWQCGIPSNVGPANAYVGTQTLGTNIAGNYSNNDSFAVTTATSPDINLTGAATPTLTFRMWVHSEGGTFDGFNLEISTDGGVTYSVVNTVTPAYTLSILGQPAWGGNQSLLGWQHVTADLSAFANQTVRLRFAFRSDPATIYPGAYIDDFSVN